MVSLKVALVAPPSDLPRNQGSPPFNLGYLASYLRKSFPSVEIKIVDSPTTSDTLDNLEAFKPDIVGVTATTAQVVEAYKIADWVRMCFPDVLTVMGGCHASALPHEASAHVDVVVAGEGEMALVEIVGNWLKGYPQQKIVFGKAIIDLDEIPSPAFDLLDLEAYLEPGPWPSSGWDKTRTIGLVTSRGCPYSCPFCWNSFREVPVRYFSAERVADEIEFFVAKFHVNGVFFQDDEFVINKRRLRELKVILKERDLLGRFVWGCGARVQSLDLETLQLMKSMGCVFVLCGMESHNRRVLNFLKNNTTTPEQQQRALENAEKVGIAIWGSFIFGSPDETLDEMRETANWIESEEALIFVSTNVLLPFPKTRLWEICQEQKLLPQKVDYQKIFSKKPYILCGTMPEKTFQRFIQDKSRVAWVVCRFRMMKHDGKVGLQGLLRLARFKTFWWVLAFHPFKLLRSLQQVHDGQEPDSVGFKPNQTDKTL